MKLYRSLLLLLLVSFVGNARAQTPENANVLLKKACEQAAKTNKIVLLMFHASWCVWCHKMDSSLNDPSCKKAFDNNFVIEHVTVQESKGKEGLQNPGGEELMEKFNGKNQGLPYWVILDKDGKLLFDSQIRQKQPDGTLKGSNMGCPASADEVKTFINMLREVTKMNDAEIGAIVKRFRMNEN